MGNFGKLEEKLRAIELRKQGLSYGEILLEVKVSKDTISRWCRDVILTEDQRERLLTNKLLGQRKGSLIAANNKRQARILRTRTIFEEARVDLGAPTRRNKFFFGLALYAGEGNKSDGRGGLANADPKIIKYMMEWFKEYCQIPLEKFRGALWLHEGLDEGNAKKFWSKLTGIPEEKFHKTYIAKDKKNSRKIRKNIHEHGVFMIRFMDAQKQRKIMGWISAVLDDKIPTVH